jgi:hypothetical protein
VNTARLYQGPSVPEACYGADVPKRLGPSEPGSLPMTQHELTAWVPPGAPPKRRIGRIVFWVLFAIAAATLAGGVALSGP